MRSVPGYEFVPDQGLKTAEARSALLLRAQFLRACSPIAGAMAKLKHTFAAARGLATRAQPRVALLCPGQGAQKPGMGRDLAEHFAIAKQVYEEVDDALKELLSKKMFSGTQVWCCWR